MFRTAERRRVGFSCGDEVITKQAMKAECDIHNILRQYQRTGIITHITQRQARYMDLPDELDFQAAQNTIIQAEAAFASLPAKVRDSFDNDPAAFLAAVQDPEQADKLRDLGVLKPLEKAVGPSTASAAPTPAADTKPA